MRALPHGLDSYPEVTQKAFILKSLLQDMNAEGVAPRLPAELRALITTPAGANDWLPEVRVQALMLALGDLLFPGDDSAFERHIHKANHRLLDGPIYSLLFRLLGPVRICRGAAGRWEQFHRNTRLTMQSYHSNGCVLTIDAPLNHVPPVLARHYAIGLQVALELAGGQAVMVEPTQLEQGRVRYDAHWT